MDFNWRRCAYMCANRYEKDRNFVARSQGYGLTMQQGARTVKALGLEAAVAGAAVWSSRHFIFDVRSPRSISLSAPRLATRHRHVIALRAPFGQSKRGIIATSSPRT